MSTPFSIRSGPWNRLPPELLTKIATYVLPANQDEIHQYRQCPVNTSLVYVDRKCRAICLNALAGTMAFVKLKIHHCRHINHKKSLAKHHHEMLQSQAIRLPELQSSAGSEILQPSLAVVTISCPCSCAEAPLLCATVVCDRLNILTLTGIMQIHSNSLPMDCRNILFDMDHICTATSELIMELYHQASSFLRGMNRCIMVSSPVSLRPRLSECRPEAMSLSIEQTSKFIPLAEFHLGSLSKLLKQGLPVQDLLPAVTGMLEILQSANDSLSNANPVTDMEAQLFYDIFQVYSVLLFKGLSEFSLLNERTEEKQTHWIISDDKFAALEHSLLPWEMNLWGAGSEFSKLRTLLVGHHNSGLHTAILLSLIQFRTAIGRAGTLESNHRKATEMYPAYMIIQTLDEFDWLRESSVVAEEKYVQTWLSQFEPFMKKLRKVFEGSADAMILDEPISDSPVDLGFEVMEDANGCYLQFGDYVLQRSSGTE